MRALPLRLAPIDEESLPGYLRRYGSTFAIAPLDTLRATGLLTDDEPPRAAGHYSLRLTNQQAARFCTATGLEREQLSRMLLWRFEGVAFAALPREDSTQPKAALGDEISLWTTRACPDCLRADGTWRLRWLLPMSVLCARHERLLLWRCPACKGPLRLGYRADWPRDDRGPEQRATSCWHGVKRGICRCLLHEADSPHVGGNQPLLAAQRRIDRILDGQAKPMLAGQECEPLQYLRDLRALIRLVQRQTPRRKGPRKTKRQIAAQVYADRTPPRLAAALPQALAMADLPHPDALCDSIRELADRRYAQHGRVLAAPKERSVSVISPLLREAIVHAGHTASYAQISARFGFDPHRHRRPAELHPDLEARHVPQLYWREDYERELAQLFRFDKFSPSMGRRLCSVLLVRMLTPADWEEASDYLGLPEHFKHKALSATLAKFAGNGSQTKLIETIKRSASHRAASGGLIDYEQRRAHLATWQGIDASTWPYLRPGPRPDFGRPDLPGRRAHASLWLWCELTSGHQRAAPLARPDTLERHWVFKERQLDELRERLLLLGQLLLDTPTAARSSIPTQLAAALSQRGELAAGYQLPTADPIISERVLAHVSAHTGVDVPTLKRPPPRGSSAPAAVTHARILAAGLLRTTALMSPTAIASTIGGSADHLCTVSLHLNPTVAAELKQLVRAVEDWETPVPLPPNTPHGKRMRGIAMTIKAHATELIAKAHGSDLARRTSILACYAHTDLAWATIAALHNVNSAQATFSRAAITHHRRIDPDFDQRYQQLSNRAQELQQAAGFANAQLTRGLTGRGTRPDIPLQATGN